MAGDETILLVDDDPDARRSMRRVLERKGYQVLEAGDPDEAGEAAERHASEIALAVLDVVLPDKDGVTVGSELAATIPDLRVLYMSGYLEGELPEGSEGVARSAFLAKPFTVEELLDRVRELLDDA